MVSGSGTGTGAETRTEATPSTDLISLRPHPPTLRDEDRQILMRFVHRTFGHSRFTQDSPIRPDVWLAYWEELAGYRLPNRDIFSLAMPNSLYETWIEPKVDLIISPTEGVGAGECAHAIESSFLTIETPPRIKKVTTELSAIEGDRRAAIRRRKGIAYSTNSVQANLSFRDVLVGLVPLSRWWHDQLEQVRKTPDLTEAQKVMPLGALVLSRIDEYESDQKSAGTLINEAIRDRRASYQLYRFIALASFTWRLTVAVMRAAAWEDMRAGPTQSDKPVLSRQALRKHLKLAEKLTSEDALFSESFAELGEDLHSALTWIDMGTTNPGLRAIFSVSVNRRAQPAIERSRLTVKADAAAKLFDIDARGIAWAVIDSGIDARHPAFQQVPTSSEPQKGNPNAKGNEAKEGTSIGDPGKSRIKATYDFTFVRSLISRGSLPPMAPDLPEADKIKVQAILNLNPDALDSVETNDNARSRIVHALSREGQERQNKWLDRLKEKDSATKDAEDRLKALRDAGQPIDWGVIGTLVEIRHDGRYRAPVNEHGTHVAGILAGNWVDVTKAVPNKGLAGPDLVGICPDLVLYDIRAFDIYGRGTEDTLIYAIEFVRHLNRQSSQQVIHGVNLSLAVSHEVQAFAAGQTPVCVACNDLVKSGVVVVAAAGNMGYEGDPDAGSLGQNARDISITDPGNAEDVITVGSTHRDRPHAYGISYFSSRGPTADGRVKPDLVAPGEKIVGPVPGPYVLPKESPKAGASNWTVKSLDGTSMATPHVSGVAALLLARHRELIGQPAKVKEILKRTATDLGRLPTFQGAGLVDALRALQSV